MINEIEKKLQEEAFLNSPLNEEEQWYEDNSMGFAPSKNQIELRQSLVESAQNTIKMLKKRKRTVTINLDSEAIDYFKQLALETGIAYQSLINLFLVQCAKEKKYPIFK